MRRRLFLESATAAGLSSRFTFAAGTTIAVVQHPQDTIAAAAPAKWALRHLEEVLTRKGAAVKRYERPEAANGADLVLLAGPGAMPGSTMSAARAEALSLAPAAGSKQPTIYASGHDARGLVYALLELADLVDHAAAPLDALTRLNTAAEQPANGPQCDAAVRQRPGG